MISYYQLLCGVYIIGMNSDRWIIVCIWPSDLNRLLKIMYGDHGDCRWFHKSLISRCSYPIHLRSVHLLFLHPHSLFQQRTAPRFRMPRFLHEYHYQVQFKRKASRKRSNAPVSKPKKKLTIKKKVMKKKAVRKVIKQKKKVVKKRPVIQKKKSQWRPRDSAMAFFQHLDKNNSGKLSLNEFKSGWKNKFIPIYWVAVDHCTWWLCVTGSWFNPEREHVLDNLLGKDLYICMLDSQQAIVCTDKGIMIGYILSR